MLVSTKMSRWDGAKKTLVRALKVQAVKQAHKDGLIAEDTVALTLAGAKAHFEIALATKNLVKPENIITIQCPTKPNHKVGDKVLRSLLGIRNESLPGMHVWPSSFDSFCQGYTKERTHIPAVSTGKNKAPAWHRATTFRREMHKFIDLPTRNISVADIDLCGIFSEENASSTLKLMENDVLADNGVMFINHQKGRDGQCVSFLEEHFHFGAHFNMADVRRYWEEPVTLTLEGKTKEEKKDLFYLIRYRLVPIYYTVKAFEAGYCLELDRLVEYRDKNSDSGVGVNMLQWLFTFSKRESVKMASTLRGATVGKYYEACQKEIDLLQYQLELLASESYPYDNHVD
jgi:hypothetical protein